MSLKGAAQDRYLDFVGGASTVAIWTSVPARPRLEARIQSFELAARMQVAAKEALDLSQESEATKAMYGIGVKETDDFGNRCLIARRLIERGVRFVSIFTATRPGTTTTSILTTCRPPALRITLGRRQTRRGAGA